jgi:hypothetical protein
MYWLWIVLVTVLAPEKLPAESVAAACGVNVRVPPATAMDCLFATVLRRQYVTDAPGTRVRETVTPAAQLPDDGLLGVAPSVQLAADATYHAVRFVAVASVESPVANEKVTLSV